MTYIGIDISKTTFFDKRSSSLFKFQLTFHQIVRSDEFPGFNVLMDAEILRHKSVAEYRKAIHRRGHKVLY